MSISRNTFDPTKSYKRVRFHEDRDLLDSELNELQEMTLHDRQLLWDRIFTPGSILQGLVGTVNGTQVIFTGGSVYLDGHPVSVPGATLSFPDPGEHTIYVDVFRREITAVDDPDLVNPLTGEPTAEREKWVASLQTRDTSGDPLPEGATGRTVVAVYAFDREAGTLTPVVEHVVSPDDPATLEGHIGQGGLDQHPAATAELAGFLTPAEKVKLEAIAPNATRGQRSATLVIAAADTSAAGKTAADYLCTGEYTLSPKTGDQDTINAAIAVVAALPGGGTIVLLDGTRPAAVYEQLFYQMLARCQTKRHGHHRDHLPGSLGDRALLQGDQAAFAHQNVRRHQRERAQGAALDGAARHPHPEVPAIHLDLRLAALPSGRVAPLASLRLPPSAGLARRSLRGPPGAGDARPTHTRLWDSIRGHCYQVGQPSASGGSKSAGKGGKRHGS